jgi:hypothetical protein
MIDNKKQLNLSKSVGMKFPLKLQSYLQNDVFIFIVIFKHWYGIEDVADLSSELGGMFILLQYFNIDVDAVISTAPKYHSLCASGVGFELCFINCWHYLSNV